MSQIGDRRKAFAAQIAAAPDGHVIDLQLFDGETLITGVPFHEKGLVVINISRDLKFHASMSPEIALRLAADLSWAAIEVGDRRERKAKREEPT